MNNLGKAIILSSLLLAGSITDKGKDIVNYISYEISSLLDYKDNKKFDILESEQITLKELKKELDILYKTIKDQREKVNYEIVRLKSLGVAGYNKKKIEESEKLIDKYDLELFDIIILLKKINNGEISQEDANKEFREIESIVGDLFITFNDGGYLFINKETETARKD